MLGPRDLHLACEVVERYGLIPHSRVEVKVGAACATAAPTQHETPQLNSVVDLDNMLVNIEYLTDRLHSFFEVRF